MPSTRNGPDAHASLFQSYGCQIILLPEAYQPSAALTSTIAQLSIKQHKVPDLEALVSSEQPRGQYSWKWNPDTILEEDLVGLQTSGSTGMPKKIVPKHGFATVLEYCKELPARGLAPLHPSCWADRRALLGFPLFHAAALALVITCLHNEAVLVLPPSDQPLHPQLVDELVDAHNIQTTMLPPSLLVDMASQIGPDSCLNKLQYAYTGGGPLPKESGDKIQAAGCKILNSIGSSEAGMLPGEVLPDDVDWRYAKFSPIAGIEMRPFSEDLHEMVLVRDEKLKDFQLIFRTFPELQEYHTNDLYSPHPTREGLWLWTGRADDIIVYSTGEKFNPASMEDTIGGHPDVKSALICGHSRFLSSLLIEPNDRAIDAPHEELIDRIWPAVEEANKEAAAYARVLRHMIVVTRPDAPLPRSGKGQVQRKAALKLYAPELDDLYASAEADNSTTHNGNSGQSGDGGSLSTLVLQTMQKHCKSVANEESDIFAAGIDSLGVFAVARDLGQTLGRRDLTVRTVYQHPTASSLANWIKPDHHAAAGAKSPKDMEAVMQTAFDRFTNDLPLTARLPTRLSRNRKSVILTGSTGSLGTYLLDTLLKDDSVDQVVCLNRRAEAASAQLQSLKAKGLSTSFSKPVTFAQADFSQPYFGLARAVHLSLLQSITHVIHNAWPVNFNMPLQSFLDPHVKSVRDLIDFSSRSAHDAQILFISSIGAVSGYGRGETGRHTVPEDPIEDWTIAKEDIGYSQSKFVSERILVEAARELGTRTAICRVGQLAGPSLSEGEWQKQEWFPSIIASSIYLGALPSTLGPMDIVDWIPVDRAALAIVDFLNHASSPEQALTPTATYHCINPSETTWAKLLPAVQAASGITKAVSFAEWVSLLAQTSPNSASENPAIKLLDFFESMVAQAEKGLSQVQLDTHRSREASPTIRNLPAISSEIIQLWWTQWSFTAPGSQRKVTTPENTDSGFVSDESSHAALRSE